MISKSYSLQIKTNKQKPIFTAQAVIDGTGFSKAIIDPLAIPYVIYFLVGGRLDSL